MERGYRFSLPQLVKESVVLLEGKLTRPAAEVRADVIEFIRLRLVNLLTGQDSPADVVDAVLAAAFDDVVDAVARVTALAELKGREDFEPLAVAFKRVVNIIKGGVATPVDPGLFEADCERALQQALAKAAGEVATGRSPPATTRGRCAPSLACVPRSTPFSTASWSWPRTRRSGRTVWRF